MKQDVKATENVDVKATETEKEGVVMKAKKGFGKVGKFVGEHKKGLAVAGIGVATVLSGIAYVASCRSKNFENLDLPEDDDYSSDEEALDAMEAESETTVEEN